MPGRQEREDDDRPGQAGRGGDPGAGDPRETAQLIWRSVHGAVSLELGGAVLTPDPAATYEALLHLLVAGLR